MSRWRKSALTHRDLCRRRILPNVVLITAILCCCCLFGVGAQEYGSTDAGELEALFDVLGGISPDTNWRDQLPDPCNSWQQGIYCLADNDTGELHVTNLEFGVLSDYIDVIPCSGHASLHPSIGKLPFLQSLQIFSCFTSQSASIPEEIGMLQDLQILTFQDNPELRGTLPLSLGNLTNLQRLSVTETGMEGTIPSEIGSLVNLRQLDLSRNQLQGFIPESLNSLGSLQIMDFGGNFLSGVLPFLGGLRSVVKMVLSNNLLNGSIPSDMGQLTTLTYLDLSYNNLTGGIPSSFANLTNLENLFLEHNDMGTSLPSFLGSMPALSRLTLAQSNYVGEIPPAFGNMTNLRVLVLKDNLLSGVIPAALGALPNIYHLDLSRNNLTGPVPFSLGFVEKMGSNLIILNNSGLCFPHSSARVAVSTIGVNSCILEEADSSNFGGQAKSPSESALPGESHRNDASGGGTNRFLLVLAVTVSCGFHGFLRWWQL
ncbi:hypothetical protein MPTK1_4g00970 [Marchantia polymorpha subsp. ruderalis]|uniref:Disease resistance R13L4/SHOC-2-like LRR domain-containing protein n=2 Tax=Marchantia polymorpha TaxID=3197 RepID=A0AAF6B512_MARPO|nr:hypothetical protein MARPO_0066s0046 [Marchantia polymorpha]BBN07096.1 hypothetical protein Mp_4g00970 [Marchantia polymorpha subsp. ruderalis]|eukprot:PTQ36088.1 hypothetical protein MARPO_0066s0046 [Marchantia polymorpha]